MIIKTNKTFFLKNNKHDCFFFSVHSVKRLVLKKRGGGDIIYKLSVIKEKRKYKYPLGFNCFFIIKAMPFPQ